MSALQSVPIEGLTVKALILRAKSSVPEHIKQAIKNAGGFWADMYDGYVLKIHYGHIAEYFKQSVRKHDIRETIVPISLWKETGKRRFLDMKYAIKLQEIFIEELKLSQDIHQYEYFLKREKGTSYMMRDASFFQQMPEQGLRESEYEMEHGFYKRWLKIQDLRAQIKEVDDTLKELLA